MNNDEEEAVEDAGMVILIAVLAAVAGFFGGQVYADKDRFGDEYQLAQREYRHGEEAARDKGYTKGRKEGMEQCMTDLRFALKKEMKNIIDQEREAPMRRAKIEAKQRLREQKEEVRVR